MLNISSELKCSRPPNPRTWHLDNIKHGKHICSAFLQRVTEKMQHSNGHKAGSATQPTQNEEQEEA
eukprot:4701511-Amphidinium_carterae.1